MFDSVLDKFLYMIVAGKLLCHHRKDPGSSLCGAHTTKSANLALLGQRRVPSLIRK